MRRLRPLTFLALSQPRLARGTVSAAPTDWEPDLPRLHRQRQQPQRPLVRRRHPHRHLGGVTVSGHRDRHRLPPRPRYALAYHLRTELVSDALANAAAARTAAQV
jgi:hypothetical protein